LAARKIKDKFIALDKSGTLTTWNSVTGKLEKFHKLTNIDFSSYEIF